MASLFESLAVTGSRKADGSANASGRCWVYRPGTQTAATIYGDAAQSAPISNPVTLNAGGKATIYFAGQVDVFLETSTGLPISTLTLAERAERVEVRNAGFTGLLPSGSQGAGGATDLNTVLSSIASSVGGLDGKYNEFTGATSRNIADKFREVFISVKDYGAVGDGIANDSTAIQRAANEVARLGGGVLYFPPGTYNFDAQTTISAANIAVRGAGMDASILSFSSTAAIPLIFNGQSTAVVEDLQITCSGNNTQPALTIVATRVFVTRVKISKFFTGISISGSVKCKALIVGCDITTVSNVSARGIAISNTVATFGRGNYIVGNTINSGAGIDVILAANTDSSWVGPGNSLLGTIGLFLDNSGGTLNDIAYLGNFVAASSRYSLNPGDRDPVVFSDCDRRGTASNIGSGGTFTPDRTVGTTFKVACISAGVAVTIADPTPTPPATSAFGRTLTLILRNAVGGGTPVTGWTFSAAYRTSAAVSTVDANITSLIFMWDQDAGKWREISRAVTT